MQKWAGQIRRGDVIIFQGHELTVTKIEPVFGGSWFNFTIKGHEDTEFAFGHSEKVEVKG